MTPERLALLRKLQRGQGLDIALEDIPLRPMGAGAPLSFAQESLWVVEQVLAGDGPVPYNEIDVLRLRGGAVDVQLLQRGLAEVVRRHESMRTTIRVVDGAPVPAVVEPWMPELPFEDLPGLSASERDAELRRRAHDEVRRRFDPTGPLFRGRVVRFAPDDQALILTTHHIVFDAPSLGLLLRELEALYAAFAAGEPSPLDDIPIQYGDYAIWDRRRTEGDALAGPLAWWKQYVGGCPDVLELALDDRRPSVQRFDGGQHDVRFAPPLVDALRALGREEGATLFMTVLAAFGVLLYRHSGQHEFLIGSPIANRAHKQLESLVGLFVNTLPLRIDCRGNPTFRQLLSRVREGAVGALKNQALPFEKLVAELRPRRDLARNPLFQVTFGLYNPPATLAFGDAKGRLELVPNGRTKFDLGLDLFDEPDGLRGLFEYSIDLFTADRIARMAGHLETILRAAASAPDTPIDRIPILTSPERQQLARWRSGPRGSATSEPCGVHALVAAQVDRSPDAPAITLGDTTLTYRELDRRGNALAHALVEAGARAEVRVAVCLERSIEMVVAVLAILRSGGVYVPVDPAWPDERVRTILQEAGVAILLTDSPRQTSTGIRVVRPSQLGGDGREARVATDVDPGQLAYVMFTSGSTGVPKGVMITHAALCDRLRAQRDAMPLEPGDAMLLKATATFDMSVEEMLVPLVMGARVVVAVPGGERDPVYLTELIARERVTHVDFVPSMLEVIVDEPGFAACTSLEQICSGGEALTAELRSKLFARSGAELVNMYGPTETTIDALIWRCRRDDAGVVPIGRPWPDVTAYILDAALEPVPVDVAGELYLGGEQLARGYTGRPGLTAERFLPDRFASRAARMYRTGDKARWREDGAVEFLGRIDDQVKIRGLRIEPGEIEAVLRRHAQVCAVAVAPREGPDGEMRLIAYVVADNVSTDEVRRYAAEQLPEYMVPSVFVPLDALPRNATGKLDRSSLPDPGAESWRQGVVETSPPQTPDEIVVAALYAELLAIPSVGRDENFFLLGGHSLLAVRLVTLLRERSGVVVSLPEFFRSPTVEAVAAQVVARRAAPVKTSAPQLVPRGLTSARASYQQRVCWNIHHDDPTNSLVVVAAAWRLEGELHVDALRHALGLVVERHHALRTAFRGTRTALRQEVAVAAPSWHDLDLSSVPPGERDERYRAATLEHVRRPFDLERGQLLHGLLIRMGPTEHVFAVAISHIGFDGQSTDLFVAELARCYRLVLERGAITAAAIGPPALQYIDYCEYQRRLDDSPAGRAELRFWRDRLADAPPLQLMEDFPRAAVDAKRDTYGRHIGFAAGHVHVDLPQEVSDLVAERAAAHGVTPYMFFLAGFIASLHRLTGQLDIVVQSTYAHRDSPDKARIIGYLGSYLYMRVRLRPDSSLAEVIDVVRDAVAAAFQHPNCPLYDWVPHPLARINFNYVPSLNTDKSAFEVAPGLIASTVPDPHDGDRFKVMYDLMVFPIRLGGVHRLAIRYNAELFRKETIERLSVEYARVVTAMVHDATTRLRG